MTAAHVKHGIPITSVVDLDVDIGADAVDYNAIANQESLSGLETEMRKLESVVEEILNEMDYLKKREAKMRDTNGACMIGRTRLSAVLSPIYEC